MPCYLEDNVDRQRGKGVFEKSIRGLQQLNALGYGRDGSGLMLNLVYNPQGPSLPPPQEALEADYRRVLGERYGIVFNHLFTLANMPIKRFGSMLAIKGEFDRYLGVLRGAHADANLDHVMCRNLISVDWQGFVYDCDFNQMLDLPLAHGGRPRVHLSDLLDADLADNPIRVAGHCYGCTAGQGSSCGGALAQRSNVTRAVAVWPASPSSCRCSTKAKRIAGALDALAELRALGVEVIVVDGGSQDATVQRARLRADHVLSAPRGRALQMNAGAAKASGDVLLFLHADTRLPPEAERLVLDGLARSGHDWGRFDVTHRGAASDAARWWPS